MCVVCVCAQSEWHVWYINMHMNMGCVHSVRVTVCEREGEDVWYRVCDVGCVVCVCVEGREHVISTDNRQLHKCTCGMERCPTITGD